MEDHVLIFMKKWYIVLVVVVAAGAAGLWLYARGPEMQQRGRFLMDTYCTIRIPGDRGVIAVIDRALDRMEEIDEKFNALSEHSALYAFNERNEPVADREIVDVVAAALKVSGESGGALDITVFPLVKLWGFYGPLPENPRVPRQKEIDEQLRHVDYRALRIVDGKVIKLRNDVKIDLGAVAKGYAVKEAVKVLKDAGIASALIDAGGDIYALGKLNGKPWKIAIRNPRGEGVIGVMELSDVSAATSGDYERFFEKDGVRYHHILDPKTGLQARGLMSATVVTPDPLLGDALSTTLFVLGREKALRLIERRPGTGAVLVTPDGEISSSPGVKLEAVKNPLRKKS